MKRFFSRRNEARSAGHILNKQDGSGVQLARGMRSLAVEMRVTGTARLKEKACSRLKNALRDARDLDGKIINSPAVLRRLIAYGRLMEACARQADAESGDRLPASGNKPRILACAEFLLENIGHEMDAERIVQGIAAFDDVQALTMPELWAAPCALRIATAGYMADTAREIADMARSCVAAERWVRNPEHPLKEQSPMFYGHALRTASEQALVRARERLEEELKRGGRTPEQMIRLAHARETQVLANLEQLMAAMRFLEGLDWKACFEALSGVEAQLRQDPSDTYAHMDDVSRDAVRRQVSRAARKLKLSEITIARYAVSAAAEAFRKGEARKGTVCWWLMTDEGLRGLARRMGMNGRGLPLHVPDPSGKKCIGLIMTLAALFSGAWMLWVGSVWLMIPGIFAGWMAANAVIGRFFPRLFPPARLLSMEIERLEDDQRTLVVMPVLLSSPERAVEMCRQMEAAGCLERDRNIRYLLLGDFSDDSRPRKPGDAAIVSAARKAVREMNDRAGWEKYGYIHRPRTFLKADRRWMGFDRKRGALMALNRLLMGMPGAEDAFSVEGAACSWLKEGCKYVVTLDADTRFLPGTIRKLVGIMAHPLNRYGDDGRGYGILQPNMEMMPAACKNEFVRLFAGTGGLNTYPASVSSFWQDLTGEGLFQGKGIYDVQAFYEALEGALPEGRILSHDLIEGAIVRAGFAGHVSFYDGYPASLPSVMKRLNRWTRGDWQLLPFIFSKKPLSKGKKLTAPQRFRMIDNLMRSLYAPAMMGTLILSVWQGSMAGLSAAVFSLYFSAILGVMNGDGLKWRRATAEFAVLPLTA
ncbi:MAG: hypothetical protein IKM02_04435 [Clostridia bacterium]|nr:hypothetical protein [Clostridia bacterium]